MKRIVCPECGFANQRPEAWGSSTILCDRCSASVVTHGRTGLMPPSLLTFGVKLLVATGLILFAGFLVTDWRIARLRAETTRTIQQQEEQEAREARAREDQLEAAHQARLRDSAFLAAEIARHQRETDARLEAARMRREEEWRSRVAHDPGFARTPMEQGLLEMARVGADPAVATRAALTKVANLASPPGSRVEVAPVGGGFAIKVAFKMSALVAGEAGARTKHTTSEAFRREARELSARVLRDIYDSCGKREIAGLQVTCNHAVRQEQPLPDFLTSEEREDLKRRPIFRMSRVYRVSVDSQAARRIGSFRQASLTELLAAMQVTYDRIPEIVGKFTLGSWPGPVDPNTPLQF